MDSGYEGRNNNQGKYAKKERACFLVDRINQYNNLARVTKEVRNCLRDNPVTWWRMGDDDMKEWHEEKGDQVFDFVEFYEKEAARASR